SAIECVTKTTVEPLASQICSSSAFSRSRVISSSAPNGSSISSSAGSKESARDRDALLHAARELPRMVVGEAAELDEVEHLGDAAGAALTVPARELERERDVLRDGAPVVEDRILEDDSVVVVAARLPRRLAVHHGRAA